jgi:hypothetical protein
MVSSGVKTFKAITVGVENLIVCCVLLKKERKINLFPIHPFESVSNFSHCMLTKIKFDIYCVLSIQWMAKKMGDQLARSVRVVRVK